MLGLSSLMYVRDYVQGLQNQRNLSAYGPKEDEACAHDLRRALELSATKVKGQIREKAEVETSFAKLGTFVTPGFSSQRHNTSAPLDFVELDHNVGLALNGNLVKPPYPSSDFTYKGRSQITPHSNQEHSAENNSGGKLARVSSSSHQQVKVECVYQSNDSREAIVTSTAQKALSKLQPVTQRHVLPLPPALRNSERSAGAITQISGKSRRLSPLRESSGNLPRSVDLEEQHLVVQKPRNRTKSVLHSSNPDRQVVRKNSVKSFLSSRSSLTEDYVKDAATLGRQRASTSPELPLPQPSSLLYQSPPISRVTSVGSLRHLRTDKAKSLYIGVNNCTIILPQKPNRSSNPTVTYQPPTAEGRKTPSLTPFAIIGLRNSKRSRTKMATRYFGGAQPSSTLCTGSATRRDSSTQTDAANAGSLEGSDVEYSDMDCSESDSGLDMTMDDASDSVGNTTHVSVSNLALLGRRVSESNPRDRVRAAMWTPFLESDFFEELASEIDEEQEFNALPEDMKSMMGSFQVEPSSPGTERGMPPVEGQTGLCVDFSPDGEVIGVYAADSDTKFSATYKNFGEDDLWLVKCQAERCFSLTDHDSEYDCWHVCRVPLEEKFYEKVERPYHYEQSESPEEPRSPEVQKVMISASEVPNRAQRSVSFAEASTKRTVGKQKFPVYQHSRSLSDPIVPSPLIPPSLRGPNFTQDFEENMLTLPMPPVEHAVPFSGRRSSTVSSPSGSRSIIVLSSKPKGFWAKFKDVFKGCFGAH